MMTTPAKVIGGWTLQECIGRGGNGEVWRSINAAGQVGALKKLHKRHLKNSKRCERFRREILTMQSCADICGVLPLLDSSLAHAPEQQTQQWLVTPLSVPLAQSINQHLTLDKAVEIVASLSATLALLHSTGVSHRDIKPENVFLHEDQWCLGDFGLVATREDMRLTETNERIGAIHYIAPEMLNDAIEADGRKADVYSLAKLLWRLATGHSYPLPGWHDRRVEGMTIRGNTGDLAAVSLDAVIDAATVLEAQSRPEMHEFATSLKSWFNSPPAPLGELDLRSAISKVRPVLDAYAYDQQRNADLVARGKSEWERHFREFDSVFSKIEVALHEAGVTHVARIGGGGGNATFYRLATGNFQAGNSDGRWFYQYSMQAVLMNANGRAWLDWGVNLGVSNLTGLKSECHDIHAPVVAAAGITLRDSKSESGRNPLDGQLLFSEVAEFRYGHPCESTYIAAASRGLIANTALAVASLVERFSALGNTLQTTGSGNS